MQTIISVKTHAYKDNRSYDKILNRKLGTEAESCGIVGPELVLPLRKNRKLQIAFSYNEKTTIRDVVNEIYRGFGFDKKELICMPRVAFFCGKIRYWIEDIDANFQTIVKKYLDVKKRGKIRAALYISFNSGAIYEKEGIRYYMNSRERGKHHEPHVHVCTTDLSHQAVIIIKTQEVIGDFPEKLKTKVRKRIKKDERFFLEQWNALTDGLKVDINRYYGIDKY